MLNYSPTLLDKINQKKSQIAPENPKAWRALVDFLETGNDNKSLAEALAKCVEIAENKGNFARSRPLRIRLSEVREATGNRRGALTALKEFTSNAAAVASTTTTVAAAPSTKASKIAPKAAPSAATKAAEAARDAENATMKDRSTRLFMEINADLVPAPAPVAPLAPIKSSRPKAVRPPPTPVVTTVAAAAAAALVANAAANKLTGWIEKATKAKGGLSEADIEELGDGERLQALAEYCGYLEETGGDPTARRKAAVSVAQLVRASAGEALWLEAQLVEFLSDGTTPAAREGALLAIHAMCELSGPGAEPYVVALLPLVLVANGAQSAPVRTAATNAGAAIARSLNPHAVRIVLPVINEAVESDTWRIKAGALEVMAIMVESSPVQVALALPEIVPVVSHQVSFLVYVNKK